jgi:hypothetical protein
MRLQFTILAALAVFFAFASLAPEDLHSGRVDSAAVPATEEINPGAEVPPEAPDTITSAALPSATEIAVDAALDQLAASVGASSHPDALRYAFQAYFSYRWANPGQVKNPYFYFVDFGLDSRSPRGYVFDMERLAVVEGPFTVAHGRGSASGSVGVPTRFLNRKNSNATSLGLYLAQETYNFRGRSAGRSYRSVGLRLKGVSGSFNNAARARGIVVHGAPYVTAQRAGRSEGCPAMELDRAQRLIPMIANGGMVFHFSPTDERWLREDPWAAGAARFALAD